MIDPFYVVKGEVQKTAEMVNLLHEQWVQLKGNLISEDEFLRVTDELKNNLRNIEWDLEDLEETIRISQGNPKKFHLDENELSNRKTFVTSIRSMTEKIKKEIETCQSLKSNSLKKPIDNFSHRDVQQPSYSHYNTGEPDNEYLCDEALQHQQLIIKSQDEQLISIGSSIQTLKSMSNQIGVELDKQSTILDDFAQKLDATDSKLDGVMKKIAKTLHMSNDRRQWLAIGILLIIFLVVVVLFIVL